ncbi:MAG: DUF3820 family protein [Flavobacteriales bacterium]|nr:DUF3820 family protein [Flavobacteriales bacterium]MBX2959705.1 DUF3820 family protein [Flavobacteriales bacterium]
MNNLSGDPKILLELITTQMPFGKYKGWLICNLPEFYLVWFKQKGFPKGKLGILLETMMEIRINGLEELLIPLKEKIKTTKKPR